MMNFPGHRALLGLAAALVLTACGGTRKEAALAPAAAVGSAPIVYRISSGDRLEIKLPYHPELNTEAWVRPDGKISLPRIGEVRVSGLTTSLLDSALLATYAAKLVRPEIVTIVKSSASQKVYVGGEVQTPRMVAIDGRLTLVAAIFEAGGFKTSARVSEIVVLRSNEEQGHTSFKLDLRETLRGKGQEGNVELQPYDVIYVPKSGIAKANQFMDDFVDGLLPLSSISGFAWVYSIVRN